MIQRAHFRSEESRLASEELVGAKRSSEPEPEQEERLLRCGKRAERNKEKPEPASEKLEKSNTDSNKSPHRLSNNQQAPSRRPLRIAEKVVLELASLPAATGGATQRLLLVACYWLLAFSSLVLLLLQLNSHVPSCSASSELKQSTSAAGQRKALEAILSAALPASSRAKRSLEVSSGRAASKHQQRPQAASAVERRLPRPVADRKSPTRRAPSNRAPASRLPGELTERHFWPNNRGTQTNGTDLSLLASQSDNGQWIPIVNRIGVPGRPLLAGSRRPHLVASQSSPEAVEGAYLALEGPRAAGRHPHENHLNPGEHFQLWQPPRAPLRHWRRPRLQAPPERVAKMYKRVLLCDKTLVSLDYIRNLGPEPRPLNYFDDADFNNLDNENLVELASRLRPSLAILSDRSSNFSSSFKPPGDSALAEETAESANLERRFAGSALLADEDPLVKCDMWDLEKGLKNRKPPGEILRMAVRADFNTVRDAINRCRQLSEKTHPNDDDQFRDGLEIMSTEDLVSLFSIKRGLIPGTKWCGLGDIADSYNDLGPKHRIDICCRAHDHCPIRLKPFRNDYGVLNIALYTKSHCDCDADFYRCLREVHSRTADMLGNLYFNVMKLQCMKEERMKVCREVKPIALGFERCVRYEESPVKRIFRFTTPPVAY